MFSPALRCSTAGHWVVGRNGAYGYKHQYLGDAEKPALLAGLLLFVRAEEGIEGESLPM